MLVLSLPARFPLRVLLAFVLGCLHAASFVDDTTWVLETATLAGLVALVVRDLRGAERPRDAWRAAALGARAGFGFGLGWFVVGISWIWISLHTFGGMNAVVAAAAVVLLAAYLSVYPALACAVFAALSTWRRPAPPAMVAGFAGAWALSEYARGIVLTGFPWLATGYAHVASPLAGYAPLVGVYGLSFVAAAVAATFALAATRGGGAHVKNAAALALVVGLPLAGMALRTIDWSTASGRPIPVRLVQGNVAQDTKFDEATFDAMFAGYLDLVEEKRADLVVLPETVFPVFLDALPRPIVERVARVAESTNGAIAFGVPIREPGGRYFNSVVAFDPTIEATSRERSAPPPLTADVRPGETPDDEEPALTLPLQRYDKSHLVPFGEFVPTGFHWFVALMYMPLGEFTRGSETQAPMRLAGTRVAFNVCYEDLFGALIARQARDANVLVNVSNVAWFGDSLALPQHLDISRMRAIETARPMLRATNTGMTASIDPHGRVLGKLAPFTRGSLDVDVQPTTGTTPYVRFGDAPAIALALAATAALVLRTRAARAVPLKMRGSPPPSP